MYVNEAEFRTPNEDFWKKKRKEKEKAFFQHATELINESAVTGVAPIVNSKGCCRKFIKIVILTFGVAGFFYQSTEFLGLYWEYSTVVQTEHLQQMKRPAFTICDKNLIRRIYYCTFRPEKCRYIFQTEKLAKKICSLMSPYCIDEKDFYKYVPIEIQVRYEDDFYAFNFTKASGFQIEEAFVTCEWSVSDGWVNGKRDVPKPCSTPTFVRGINEATLPGACYSVGLAVGNSSSESEVLEPGTQLTMELKWRTADLNNVQMDVSQAAIMPHRAYYISFHDPMKLINPFITGIQIEDRHHYKMQVTQKNYVRLEPPFDTQCQDYIKGWRKNGGRGPVNQEDCRRQCQVNANFEKYGCVPKFIRYPHENELCTDIKLNDGKLNKEIQQCSEKCKPACLEMTYAAELEVAGEMDHRESIEIYKTPSFTTLEISFDSLNSVAYLYKPKFESVELFSYIGGYLGMWLGWSLLAVFDFFEILYRVSKYPFTMRRKPKRSTVKPVLMNY